MSSPRKYIPPHLRARGAGRGRGRGRGGPSGREQSSQTNSRSFTSTTQRNFNDRFGYRTDEEFVVTLKSKQNYEDTDMPSPVLTKAVVKPGNLNYKFKVGFQEDKLRELLRWFRNLGRHDNDAVLEFPPALDKERRREVHLIADNFGLGTSSQGFGNNRFISVYTVEAASFGVGQISMTEEEKRKADNVWLLVRKFGSSEYMKHSHNEIKEMVIADCLDPELQDLLDKNQEFLASEFERKCNINEGNWRDHHISPDNATDHKS